MLKTVIKYGGHALEDEKSAIAFAAAIAAMKKADMQAAIVHGGGPQINALLKNLNIESHFQDGLRVTDAPTLTVVEMALCGQVNKAITRLLAKNGVIACGISGQDGGLFLAEQKNPALGLVGAITSVSPALPLALMANGFTPVIAPLALNECGEPLNVNADTAAGALAGALEADYFVLISDVPGVLDANGNLLPSLTQAQVMALTKEGVIHGGMIPKTKACLAALDNGAKNALILDGRNPDALKDYLATGKGPGTLLTL